MELSRVTLLLALSPFSPANASLDSETLKVLSTSPDYNKLTGSSGALLLMNHTEPLKDVTFCWRFFQFRTPNDIMLISAKNRRALLKFYIESASAIPVDENWYYFLVYMDHKLVAYATTFDEF